MAAHQQNPEPAAPEQNKNKPNIFLTILLILLGVVVVLIGGILLGTILGGGLSDRGGSPGAPPVAVPTVGPNEPYAIANANVNVRSGPGTNYPSYGVAPMGSSAPVIGVSPDSGWWVVSISADVAADGRGWVSAAYVLAYNANNVPVIQPPAPPPDITPPPVQPGSQTVVTTEPVNVRSGPGNQFETYGKVPRGTTLEAVGRSDDSRWVAVKIPTSYNPQGIGWVNAAYLEPFDPSKLTIMPQ